MEERILNVMRTVFETDSITRECSQSDCGKWDSLQHLNLIIALENEFSVFFEPEEIASMTSFARIEAVLKEKI